MAHNSVMTTAYLAAEGFETQLAEELAEDAVRHGRLFIVPGPARPLAWAQNVWFEPEDIAVPSIGEAAKALRVRQRNWAHYPFDFHRRSALIAAKLPKVSAKPLVFPDPAPTAPLGSWTLLAPDRLLAATRCASPFANGEAHFVENHTGPPGRAYLKLWEALTVIGRRPGPGDRCLDLGASPGGWTWVLAGLGARVMAVDKAPLDPRIAALPNVETRRESAFGLDPGAVGAVDWLCCDVICYPDRLLTMIRRWLERGAVRRFVCTLKFQGATDHETARAFAAIPGSRLVHLFHNKHELTWIRLEDGP